MFPSHRPKVFRSRLGCCICGAKSSSSRFTTSTKYESQFKGCFDVSEQRTGEICNACVLLVKRWTKLPPDSSKNWKHVVDSKATVKRSSKPRRSSRNGHSATHTNGHNSCDNNNGSAEEMQEDDTELDESLTCLSPSPTPSEASDEGSSLSTDIQKPKQLVSTACQTTFLFPSLSTASNKLPYIDLSTWRHEEICCGTIFRGPFGEVLVDPKLLHPFCPCSGSIAKPAAKQTQKC